MNLRALFFVMGWLIISHSVIWGQTGSLYSTKSTAKHQVMRNADQTYAHFQWVPTEGATSYDVLFRNVKDQEWERFTTTKTSFTVSDLNVPAKYQWSIIPRGDAIETLVEYNIEEFSTAYNSAQKVGKDMFAILMGWDGSKEEGMTLGQYMRENRPSNVSEESVETFIQNYYGGRMPESITDEPCNCQVFLQDNFIPDPFDDFPPITEGSYTRYGTADNTGGREELGSAKYMQRKLESNYVVSYGAAKDLSFNLEGRANNGQIDAFNTDPKTDQTFIVAKFVCTGVDCGDCQDAQRFDVWAKYNIDMQFDEWLAGPGAYGMTSQDAAMFMEISNDGVENLGELITGIMRQRDVAINPDALTNWLNVFSTTFSLANSIFNFVPVGNDDDDDNSGLDEEAIIGNITGVIEAWVNAINTPTYVTNVNEGVDVTSQQEIWKHETCIEPNGWRCFAVVTSGRLGYTDVWGKKGWSFRTWEGVPPDFKISGYQKSDIGMSITAVYDQSSDDSECANSCCFNSMGKWLYYSMREDDFSVRGDIRGIFDDIGWVYADEFVHFENPPSQGSDLDFYQGNASLETNFALITVEESCCESELPQLSVDYTVDCQAIDCGPEPPGPWDDEIDKDERPLINDNSSNRFTPDPPNPAECYRLDFRIVLPEGIGSNYLVQLSRYHEDGGITTEWSNFSNPGPVNIYNFSISPFYPESTYYVTLRVPDNCGNMITENFPISFSCNGLTGDTPSGYLIGSSTNELFQQTNANSIDIDAFQDEGQMEVEKPITDNGLRINEKVVSASALELFPNPAKDRLNIRLTETFKSEEAVIELFSASGQLLQTFSIEPAQDIQTLSVANLAKGLYMIRARTASGQMEVQRVIIQ
ncbi:MAG: T9SS type A sorting domain-containing protein [Bacteroidota bacterium]